MLDSSSTDLFPHEASSLASAVEDLERVSAELLCMEVPPLARDLHDLPLDFGTLLQSSTMADLLDPVSRSEEHLLGMRGLYEAVDFQSTAEYMMNVVAAVSKTHEQCFALDLENAEIKRQLHDVLNSVYGLSAQDEVQQQGACHDEQTDVFFASMSHCKDVMAQLQDFLMADDIINREKELVESLFPDGLRTSSASQGLATSSQNRTADEVAQKLAVDRNQMASSSSSHLWASASPLWSAAAVEPSTTPLESLAGTLDQESGSAGSSPEASAPGDQDAPEDSDQEDVALAEAKAKPKSRRRNINGSERARRRRQKLRDEQATRELAASIAAPRQ
jgi:hypothetical protein